jgi:GT2 family glycosyltransferase
MPRVPIDVIIPVSKGLTQTRRCIESVLAHTGGDYRLIVIDDDSPEPAVGAYLAQLGARRLPQIRLLANERNLGFTLNANRGMSAARAGADLVLLNSDTVVTRYWLDALARCAV